jgi:GTP-binding protein
MSIPVVSIVGRPNVGKSSLLNLLFNRRLAIVDESAGTTRDRVEATIRHRKRSFRLVDTGGIGVVDRDDLAAEVERQIAVAMDEADLIIFVSDVRDGVMPLDREVAKRLRGLRKTVIPVVNKCDTPAYESEAGEFWALGFGPPLALSAKEGYGRTELLDRIIDELPEVEAEPEKAVPIKVAVVGRRNVGKSTLINALVGSERLITSSVPGTTRDAVDVPFTSRGRRFIAIDTAGMRRKRIVQENVDFFSRFRTERSIRRADVVLLMLDASADLGRIDKKLAAYVEREFRPVIIVVNKWDVVRERGVAPESYQEYVARLLPGLDYAPLAFISAKEVFNVEPTMELVEKLCAQSRVRVPTAEINRVVQEAITRRQPPRKGNRDARIYYAVQTAVAPPTVVLFVSDATLFDRSYIHYLANALRAELPYDEVPIRIELRTRERSASKRLRRQKFTPRAAQKARARRTRRTRRQRKPPRK